MSEKKITKDTFPNLKKVNILNGLPDHLKKPANFMKIQKALLETLSCGKVHSDPIKMAECSKCSENMVKRRELMTKFGFKSPQQYMAWRKTHESMKQKVPLDMYNRWIKKG